MPLLSISAMNDSLDSDYADNNHQLALFADDPSFADNPTDVELASTGGYVRVTVAPADWDAAAAGSKSVDVALPDTTAEWPEDATYFGLWDTVEGFWRDYGPLPEPIEVTGAGSFPDPVTVVVFYDDAVISTEEG